MNKESIISNRNNSNKFASKGFVLAIAVLLLIIMFLLWWILGFRVNQGGFLNKGVSPDQISIRSSDGNIEWQYLDGDWQKIVSLSDLTGTAGQDGTDGKDGVDGAKGDTGAMGINGAQGLTGATGEKGDTGANGQDGTDGQDGANGQDGIDGKDGADGVKGDAGAAGVNGQDGREVELQKGDLYIQWRYKGESEWNNIVAYSDLKGEKGDTGANGQDGADGKDGVDGVKGQDAVINVVNSTQPCSTGLNVTGNGTSNIGLNFTGSSIPSGGSLGQVLTKNSNDNCDYSWKNTSIISGNGFPEGKVTADAGTYYTDLSATNGAISWVKSSGNGNTGWKVVYGDTGWRSYPAMLTSNITSASVAKYRRVNNTLYINVVMESWNAGWGGGGQALPDGLQTGIQYSIPLVNRSGNYTIPGLAIVQVGSNVNVEMASAGTSSGGRTTINLSAPVSATSKTPWPVTLPGTPTN